MGYSKTTYYGPFLVYRAIENTIERDVHGCESCKTVASPSDKFCSKCGKPTGPYTLVSKHELDLVTETNEDLYSPYINENFRVAIPNRYWTEIREVGEYFGEGGTEYEFCIQEYKNPERAIAKFKELFAKHIEFLASNGGFPEVKFGTFTYFY